MKLWNFYEAIFKEQLTYFPVGYIVKEGFLNKNANQDR